MTAPVRVYARHVQACGYCIGGARKWFAGRSLNFRSFIKDGIEAETLLETGDPMARSVAQKAIAESNG